VISETSNQTGSKAVPEKVKFDVRVLAFPLPVFAVNDLGFCRMQFQAALHEAGLKFGLESLCFLLAPAVDQPIIGIPTPREIWVSPRHSEIERIVEESVRQNWANHAPYTKGNLGLLAASPGFAADPRGSGCCDEW
jgi:hypothetical protein